MTTSGTTSYNPSLGETVLYAYNLIGIRQSALVQEHFEAARMAANMLQSRISAQGVNLWEVDLQTIPLVQGQATYSVPSNTIVMLDTYIVTTSGGVTTNRVIMPISRTEYASYPNPQQQGFPTCFWNDRLINGTVSLWPVPDGTQTSLNYYRMKQIQDASLSNATQMDVPFYFLETIAYGIAYRLALIWAPDKAQILKGLYDEAYLIAAEQNVETSNIYLSPQLSSYFQP